MFHLRVEYITVFLALLLTIVGLGILGNKAGSPTDAFNIKKSPNPKINNLKVSNLDAAQAPVAMQLSLDKLLARPLFSATRRSNDELSVEDLVEKKLAQTKKPVSTIEKKEIVLHGIFKKEDLSEALISISEAKAKWYRVNDIVEGWQIEHIYNDEIVLSHEGGTKRIKLYNY